ncbi:MAG: hypothetical protein GC168_03060 [Candidatus Hydrogenedens sp.]|nr:hypothetical protein [Candidatus Hydrogenedens sp.]
MARALRESRLVRAALRLVWLVALAAVPAALPGLVDTATDGAAYRTVFGLLAALSVLLAQPAFAVCLLAVLNLHALLSAWGGPPPDWIPLACASLFALLCAGRGWLAAPRLLAMQGAAQSVARVFLLSASVFCLIPLYWDWGSPFITLYLSPVYFLLWTQMPHRSSVQIELLKALGGGLVFLFILASALELQSRLFFRDNPPNEALIAHPTRVVTLRPDSEFVYRTREFGAPPFRAQIAPEGVRGEAVGPKRTGTLRVLCLGDSHTFGWGVRDEDCYPRQLEALLRARLGEDAVEVINAGTPTYGPWQSLDWLRENGARFQPDFVVYELFPANDLANEMYSYGAYPRCYDERSTRRYRMYERLDRWPEAADFWLRDHSRFYQTWTMMYPDAEPPALAIAYGLRAWQGEAPEELPVTDLGEPSMELQRAEWYPELEVALNHVMDSVAGMQQWCDEKGADFATLVLPAINSVDERVYLYGQRQSPWACAPFEEAKPVRACEAALRQREIQTVEILGPMRAAFVPITDTPLYIPNDGHLTPEGNAVLAGAVADYLLPRISAAPDAP